MDWNLLLAGLPVAIITAAAGIWLLASGITTFGMIVVGLGVLVLMLAFGSGLPRPDVVPRPGEEGEY